VRAIKGGKEKKEKKTYLCALCMWNWFGGDLTITRKRWIGGCCINGAVMRESIQVVVVLS
jgi:hypothetical protein